MSELDTERYTRPARLLHWLIALLIVAQFALVWTADTLPRGELRTNLMLTHVSVGFTVLLLALVRIAWRFWHAPPAFPAGMAPWERWLARAAHWALYALILLMPVTGVLLWSTAGRDINWFWLLSLPVGVERNESLHEFFEGVHVLLSWALLALAVFHVFAVAWHMVARKDGLLKRMV